MRVQECSKMLERFSQFFIDSFNILPSGFWVGLILVFCLGTCVFFALLGPRKGMRWSVGLLLLEYIFLLYATTVVFRKTQIVESHLLAPFWSYQAIWEGNEQFSTQVIMNVFAFVPVGFFLTFSFREIRWWGVLLVGILISFGIEILQLLLHRGFAEFDDIFHNTLGCLAGSGLYHIIENLMKKNTI